MFLNIPYAEELQLAHWNGSISPTFPCDVLGILPTGVGGAGTGERWGSLIAQVEVLAQGCRW